MLPFILCLAASPTTHCNTCYTTLHGRMTQDNDSMSYCSSHWDTMLITFLFLDNAATRFPHRRNSNISSTNNTAMSWNLTRVYSGSCCSTASGRYRHQELLHLTCVSNTWEVQRNLWKYWIKIDGNECRQRGAAAWWRAASPDVICCWKVFKK